MKPIGFKQQNCIYAEKQSEYLPLPAYRAANGTVVACWVLTWREWFKLLFTGKMWWSVLTFNHPLQPYAPSTTSPFAEEQAGWVKRLLKHININTATSTPLSTDKEKEQR